MYSTTPLRNLTMAPTAPLTILLAEDDADDVAVLQRAFAEACLPHQLKVVSTGLEVVHYLEGNSPYHDREIFPVPTVLLLDLPMPQGGGLNVLRWLSSHPHFRDLPVVVLTGSDNDEKEAFALGAKDFYVKPTEIDDLVRIFQNISDNWLSPPR